MRLFTLALALTATLVGVPPSEAATDARTELGIDFFDDPARPHFVPTDGNGEGFEMSLTTSAPATNVRVHAEGEGLTVQDDTVTFPALTPGQFTSTYFLVSADGPGFHELTVTVTADGSEPVTATLPRLWAPGGPPLPSGGDLTGRAYGWSGSVSGVVGESSSRVTTMLTFVDGTYAYVGLPPRGVPSCPGRGCRRYYHDPATGLVQVGDALIGEVLGPRLFVEGLTPADQWDYPDFTPGVVLAKPVAAPRHTKYQRTWTYTTRSYPDGLTYQRLTLSRNGTFRLAFEYDAGDRRHLRGDYRLGRRGHLALRGRRSDSVLHGTLLVRTTLSGVQQPGRLGVWLILALQQQGRTVVDGNLLRPVEPNN